MYALRTQRWLGQYNPTGKPDGSFIRNDGLFTDNKASARLFETAEEAEVKPVLHRMIGVVKLLVR